MKIRQTRSAMFLTIAFIAAMSASAPATNVGADERDRPIVFVGAKIIPIEGDDIERGAMIVRNGVIDAVGPAELITPPADAEVRDVSGRVIMPGLICTHSHIGGIGGADRSATIQPDVRIYDSINVRDSGFRRTVAGGLTALNIMPGSGHLLSGQTVYVKLRRAEKIDDMFIYDHDDWIMGGMKMANGTNPIGERRGFPGTRGKAAALMRQHFIKSQEYMEKVRAAEAGDGRMPPRDIGLDAMIEVLDGRRIVHFHTHRHDDIMTILRLQEEFGFRVVLHHVSEGWKVAEDIAAANIPCSIILIDSPGGKLEARNLIFETGGVLEKAGTTVAYHTDDYITDSRLFFRMAALGVRGGMSRQAALESLTINGAKMMDLDHRIGSLVPGKDADFIILDGDPFSVYTKVLETWVDGVQVFDRSDPEDELYAVGGYGASHDQSTYLCCYEQGGVQ